MHTAITMFDIAVLHPAFRFTADFENGPKQEENRTQTPRQLEEEGEEEENFEV